MVVLHRLLCKQILTGSIWSMPVHMMATSCQPAAGMKYVNLCFYCREQCLHQHRILHCEETVDLFTTISSLLCKRAPKIRLLGSMYLATSWQVLEHKEMAIQITTTLSFSCERISKIMSLSSMRLATSHQSVARPKYHVCSL